MRAEHRISGKRTCSKVKPAPGGRLPVNARAAGGAATRIRESESPGATKRKKTYPRPCARPHTGPVRFDKKSGIRGAGCWRSGRSAHVLPRTGTCSGHPPPAET